MENSKPILSKSPDNEDLIWWWDNNILYNIIIHDDKTIAVSRISKENDNKDFLEFFNPPNLK
jgi:hypothetical protein